MKIKSIISGMLFVVATATTFLLPLAAEERQENVNRNWKLIQPLEDVIIEPGDEVLMSTSLHQDPFDGFYRVDENGMVSPRFCKEPVKIAGLSEIEASEVVLKHTHHSEVYNPKSGVRIKVVRANRLPDR